MFHKRSYIKCYIFDPGKLQWPLLPANKRNITWIGDEGGDGWGWVGYPACFGQGDGVWMTRCYGNHRCSHVSLHLDLDRTTFHFVGPIHMSWTLHTKISQYINRAIWAIWAECLIACGWYIIYPVLISYIQCIWYWHIIIIRSRYLRYIIPKNYNHIYIHIYIYIILYI